MRNKRGVYLPTSWLLGVSSYTEARCNVRIALGHGLLEGWVGWSDAQFFPESEKVSILTSSLWAKSTALVPWGRDFPPAKRLLLVACSAKGALTTTSRPGTWCLALSATFRQHRSVPSRRFCQLGFLFLPAFHANRALSGKLQAKRTGAVEVC